MQSVAPVAPNGSSTLATLKHLGKRIDSLNEPSTMLRDIAHGKIDKDALVDFVLNTDLPSGRNIESLAKKVRAPRKVAAAIQLPSGEMFIGRDHMHAVSQAMLKYPKTPVSDLLETAKDGFVDAKTGKYFSREEFAKLKGKKWITAEQLNINTDDVGSARAAAEEAAMPKERRSLSDENTLARKRFAELAGDTKDLSNERRQDIINALKNDPIPMQSRRLFEAIKGKNGFSIDPVSGQAVTSGFAVGAGDQLGKLLKHPVDQLSPDVIAKYLRENKLPKNTILGGWVDNGHVYIEPSTLVKDRAKAIKLGRERGEKAVGDLAKYASGEDGTINVAFNDAQKNVPRYLSNSKGTQDKVAAVEDLAYKTFMSKPFIKLAKEGEKMKAGARWYPLRDNSIKQSAVDVLGDGAGANEFEDLMGLMSASTARSRPNNNLRRASWWRAMKLAGLLDPQELKTTTLVGPEGMGHIAQRAHHLGVASYLENGGIDSINNPKPGGFMQNLIGNHRPYTNDTVMSNITADLNPTLADLAFKSNTDKTTGLVNHSPRDWAYAPMERAMQRAAEALHGRGIIDNVADGYHPTATLQENAWIGRQGAFDGGMEKIFNDLLNNSANLWGVSPVKANELLWRGQPLESPLGGLLIRARQGIK